MHERQRHNYSRGFDVTRSVGSISPMKPIHVP